MLPIGIEIKLQQVDFTQRDVMVGVVRNVKQLADNLTHRFYRIPKKSVADMRLPIHTIALYQPMRAFGKEQSGIWYYGEVVTCETLKSKEDFYYKFTVEEWLELPKRIRPKELCPIVSTYTNQFLLENAEDMPELYIKTEAEYRLYVEIKRMTAVSIKESSGEAKEYRFDENRMAIRDEQIFLFAGDGRVQVFAVAAFVRRPQEVMRGCQAFLKI
ncbi:hypothetical protein GH810_09815 [Acetobacterium paludosum]|uniref:Uncharacterized protein n=1 Tax=Acetobacterium paludosum TaxID=52693 RepID=A0A923KPY3_9FIRM|nr:hypothetical protein [Acetobacterium paludosum]MBC3888604.1 hypothetical protein [Acetobacterium paludosum]